MSDSPNGDSSHPSPTGRWRSTSSHVVVLFFYVLFTGQPNPRFKELGLSLARYVYQIVEYLTFNTEVRPFPFDADWPSRSQ